MAAIIEFQLRFGRRGSNAFPRGIRLQLAPMIALSHLEGDKGNIEVTAAKTQPAPMKVEATGTKVK